MTYTSFAIIGTAGRKEDRFRLTAAHYDRMVSGAEAMIQHLKMDTEHLWVVSGGAAWSDHVAVSLALKGVIRCHQLTLYLPCELTDYGYRGSDDKSDKVAKTANWYHQEFSKVRHCSSIDELLGVRSQGAEMRIIQGGFHARNALIAKAVTPNGALMAYTFGSDECDQDPWTVRVFDAETGPQRAGLKDGGTAHTFSLAECLKFHARLGSME